MKIELKEVKSSNIAKVGYDAESKTLVVQFAGGPTWSYEQVPGEVHTAFLAAESIGRYFAREIRPKFTGVKLAKSEPIPSEKAIA